MKKIALLTIIASLFILSGCQDPIFEAIREDVVPEDATVSGSIRSITRYSVDGSEEYLFLAADGGLRYKLKDNASHGSWASYPLPVSLISYNYDSSSYTGEELITVLADSTTLYIISAEWASTDIEGQTYPSNIKLYGKTITANADKTLSTAGDWTLITENNSTLFPIKIDSDEEYYDSYFRVFQTNSPMKAHRAAYINAYNSSESKYHYYKLNGANKLDKAEDIEITIDNSSIINPNGSENPVVHSAAYFGGEVKFFTSIVATTNETYADEATYYYYTNSSNRLYYSDGTGTPDYMDANSSYTIRSLATCKDSILIGYGTLGSNSTSAKTNGGGIDRALLNNGIPTALASFKTNAQFQITSSYMVLALLNATPDKDEEESCLYAAITFSGTGASFDNIGLWSYYPDRGNWNRE